MRDAETVLTIIRERGERKLPLEDVYRMLFNPDLYLRAYGRLYKNKGAMTKGTTDETVDEMSMAKIERLIDDVRHERHKWTRQRHKDVHGTGNRQRDVLRFLKGHGFRNHLSQNHVQAGNQDEGYRNRYRVCVEQRVRNIADPGFEHLRQHGLAQPAQC